MLDLIIQYSFYLLFFLTPLFWNSSNYELFEFNKMLLTYGITTIIVGCWVLKSISEKRLVFNRTPLDIPLLLFLASQILSTVFSMDIHTSLNGYYSRLNGGLYSTVTYLMLYWAFVSNIKKAQIKTLLKFMLASGFIISIYAIMEHFGVSPSCIILHNQFNADCWVQDVQARVFATLGQPNWLAGYLEMIIFPVIYFATNNLKNLGKTSLRLIILVALLVTLIYVSLFFSDVSLLVVYTILVIGLCSILFLLYKWRENLYYFILFPLYLAFTFTYSRGPTLGLIAGFVVFFLFSLGLHLKGVKLNLLTPLLTIIGSFLIINILFGSALTNFRLVSKFAAPTRPAISLPQAATTTTTQLENGGTESGQIRFIVWRGAWDIFKHNPIFGSGVETFAYSYYQYRPIEHNQTSEWDFLYNKAHNEYLNYLATTGIVGFGAYLLIIAYFVFWSTRILVTSKRANEQTMLIAGLLAAYISYLIYNFFLFSVVILALFFFLFPAIAFVASEETESKKESRKIDSIFYIIVQAVYKKTIFTNIVMALVVIITVVKLFSVFQAWYADTLFAQGQKASDDGNPAKAFNLIAAALDLNKNEPFYRSELAYNAAASAVGFETIDATTSAELVQQAGDEMEYVLKTNPNNVSYYRTAIRTYFELASLDKDYEAKTLAVIDKAIQLAPTDPKLYYNKAKILDFLGKKNEALIAIKKALELKPDYLEASDQLKKWTEAAKSGKAK